MVMEAAPAVEYSCPSPFFPHTQQVATVLLDPDPSGQSERSGLLSSCLHTYIRTYTHNVPKWLTIPNLVLDLVNLDRILQLDSKHHFDTLAQTIVHLVMTCYLPLFGLNWANQV